MEHWDEGVFACRSKGPADATPLILSAGVHGDEIAPVVVLEQLLADVQNRSLLPQRPCLFIIANPPALINGKRFMVANMNRLFGGGAQPPGYETRRVRALESYCRDFADLYGIGWHLDLHSTIKPSRHPHFALMPAGLRCYDDAWAPLLAAGGIGALVRQRSAARTFSHFSCTELGYESFTLECGVVGEDGGTAHAVLEPLLRRLLGEEPFAGIGAARLQQYEVVQDLIRRNQNFRFMVDEQAENFTEYAAGTALLQDGEMIVSAPCDQCGLLFANSQVPVGDRAGLLIKPAGGESGH